MLVQVEVASTKLLTAKWYMYDIQKGGLAENATRWLAEGCRMSVLFDTAIGDTSSQSQFRALVRETIDHETLISPYWPVACDTFLLRIRLLNHPKAYLISPDERAHR